MAPETPLLEVVEGLTSGTVQVLGHDPRRQRHVVRPRVGIVLQESVSLGPQRDGDDADVGRHADRAPAGRRGAGTGQPRRPQRGRREISFRR